MKIVRTRYCLDSMAGAMLVCSPTALLHAMSTSARILIAATALVLALGAWILIEPAGAPQTPASSGAASPEVSLPELEDTQPESARQGTVDPTGVSATAQEPDPELSGKAPLPAGDLEVLVLVEGVPADGGQVHLYTANVNGLARDFRELGPGRDHAFVDATGVARFHGVRAGRVYVVVELEPGSVQYVVPDLPRARGERVVVELGSASIHGRVHDDAGAPVEGARVSFAGPGGILHGIAWTDVTGSYLLRGAGPGTTTVTARRDGSWRDATGTERRVVELARGERRELDFGRSGGLPRWTGTLRNPLGEPVSSAARVGSGASLVLREPGSSAFLRVPVAEDGTFDVGVPAGLHEVHLATPVLRSERLCLADFRMPDRDLRQDLVLPGVVLRGTVRDDGAPYDGTLTTQTVSLYPLEGPPGPPEYSVLVDAAGRYTVNGLLPGAYRVRGYPRQVREGTEVRIQELDRERVLDLDLE